MEETTGQLSGDSQSQAVLQLKRSAGTMSAWLKFLGIVSIISGAVVAITIVGIIIAWLPIWLGVLLFQAGDRAYQSQYSENLKEIVQMVDKLRMYFIIYGVLTILGITFTVLTIIFTKAFLDEFSRSVQDMLIYSF